MKYILLTASFLFTIQLIGQDYWQQEVNYEISVTLDDENHALKGFEEFRYVNNSPDALNEIYIHLWPNAYKNGETALAKQLYENGNDLLVHGSDEVKGYIDSLEFRVDGQKVPWEYEEHNIDICILKLPKALQPGKSVKISTPFYVKLPSGRISRLGHIDQSYQITQWYPKPAVYDKDGWHHMPYLNQGEFYSEYGTFDVSITLPKNYVIGATGDLQTSTEIKFLDSLAQHTAETIMTSIAGGFPESSPTLKTVRYKQANVHDFAWFADKRYRVLKGEVELPHSGRKVTSWAMFTPQNEHLWVEAIDYINDGTYYYSLWNGDYPYNNVTAVDGTISAGGGMEYPNVTVIGNAGNARSLEVVIVHEVGHNWFYGQLGSNERVHGWMDEGMNTLNEIRYIQTKYPDNTDFSDMIPLGIAHLDGLSHHDLADFTFRAIASLGLDQPIETHSARFTPANYGIVMYQKTGLVFHYLKDYLGDELFDKCMQAYYSKWEFKHPQPEDMRKSLEETSGKDLSWLFDDLIQTTNHVDYKLGRVKQRDNGTQVTVKNVGQVDGPIEINAIKGDSIVASQWIEPGNRKSTVTFNETDLDAVVIDDNKQIPEINRQNNTWTKKGLCDYREPLKIEALFGDNEKENSNVFWLPGFAWNIYDGAMIGVAVHNYGIPFNPFRYFVAPLYSTKRKMVSGLANLNYTFLPKRIFKTSQFGLTVQSFKQDTLYRNNDSYYIGVAPSWTADLGNRGDRTNYNHKVRLRGIYKKDKYGPTHIEHAGAYIQYEYHFALPDHKIDMTLRNEYLTNVNTYEAFGRQYAEMTYSYKYLKKKTDRWVELRLFGGQQYIRDFNLTFGHQYKMSLSGVDGFQDQFLEEFYLGRTNLGGVWSQQRQENMGGFKSTSYYGTTAFGMATANLYVQLPIKFNLIGAYADIGVFHNGVGINEAYDAGLAVRLGQVFGVYFPLYMSDDMLSSYGVTTLFKDNSKYGEMIRFTLKLNIIGKLNLAQLI